MPSRKVEETKPDARDGDLGLLANGSSGPWDVSIDETIAGEERWFAQIEGPSVSIYFDLSSPDIISQAIRFLATTTEQAGVRHGSARANGELRISKPTELPVLLVRDDEFEDRIFLVVGDVDRPVVRWTLTPSESRDILEALNQAQEDLPKRAEKREKRGHSSSTR